LGLVGLARGRRNLSERVLLVQVRSRPGQGRALSPPYPSLFEACGHRPGPCTPAVSKFGSALLAVAWPKQPAREVAPAGVWAIGTGMKLATLGRISWRAFPSEGYLEPILLVVLKVLNPDALFIR
jgi:hypothetical protein